MERCRYGRRDYHGDDMDDGVIELSGDMRAGAAGDLRDRLTAALTAGDLRVASEGLTGVDCAIVQVLVAAGKTAAQLDRKLQIDGIGTGALGAMLERLALELPSADGSAKGN